MNILFLLRYFPYFGGGESVTVRLANAFAQEGNKVFVLYLRENKAPFEIHLEENIKCCCLNEQEINKVETVPDKFFLKYSQELKMLIDNENIEVIINQWWPSKIVRKVCGAEISIIKCHHSAIVVDSKRKRELVRALGEDIYEKILFLYLRKKYRDDIRCSDRFVVLGEAIKKDVLRIYGNKYISKVVAIPNPSKYSCLPCQFKEKKNQAIYVGRFSPEKRIDIIIRTWSYLTKEKECDDWELLLAGDGDCYDQIRKMVEDEELINVKMLGVVEPEIIYQQSKILLLASAYEGFGMVIVEAMQHGCVPIIMNTFVNCTEIVDDKTNGIVTQNNEDDFREKIRQIICDEEKLCELSENAIRKSHKYDISEITKKWNLLLNAVRNKE